MKQKQTFSITSNEVRDIKKTLRFETGSWKIIVRTGENWSNSNTQTFVSKEYTPEGFIGGCEDIYLLNDSIDGYEIALELHYDVEEIGVFAILLDKLDIRHIRITGGTSSYDKSRFWDFETLFSLPKIEKVKLNRLTFLRDFCDVVACPELRSLVIQNCEMLQDIEGLSRIPSLETLTLSSCSKIKEFRVLSSLKNLRDLRIGNCYQLHEISFLSELHHIQFLDLSNNSSLADISYFTDNHQIETLWLQSCSLIEDISPVSCLQNLKNLSLYNCTSLENIQSISSLLNLETLYLGSCGFIESIQPLSELKKLRVLNLHSCTSVGDLAVLSKIQTLEDLNLSNCYLLEDISILEPLDKIKTLSLYNCSNLKNLEGISALKKLEGLYLGGENDIHDISTLSLLPHLKTLNLYACSPTIDLGALSSFSNLQTLNLSQTNWIDNTEFLRGLQSLTNLYLEECYLLNSIHLGNLPQLENFSVYNQSLYSITFHNLPNLRRINLEGYHSLKTVGFSDMPQLKSLSFGYCEIEQIEGLSCLKNLRHLDLSNYQGLSHTDELSGLQNLQRVFLRDCHSLADLRGLSSVSGIHTLFLSNCQKISHIGPLSTLSQLRTLSLTNCSSLTSIKGLSNLSSIEYLEIGHCESLIDIQALSTLENLKILNLEGGSVEDVDILAPLFNLKELWMYKNKKLKHLDGLSNMSKLEILHLESCSSLENIQGIAKLLNLTKLTLNECKSIIDIEPLHELCNLQILEMNWMSITNVAPLANLSNLKILQLDGCKSLGEIGHVRHLSNLKELSLNDWEGIANPSQWEPLTSLHALRKIYGQFGEIFVVKVLAKNAVHRQNWSFISYHLSEWMDMTKKYPTEENIVNIMAEAVSLRKHGCSYLLDLLQLSKEHDVVGVDKIFEITTQMKDDTEIQKKIGSLMEQSNHILPEQTFVAIHKLTTDVSSLRKYTITAFIRELNNDTLPTWANKTANALIHDCWNKDGIIDTDLYKAGIQLLKNKQFSQMETCLLGILSSDFALSPDENWRNVYSDTFLRMVLEQKERAIRNLSLHLICVGLSRSSDTYWIQAKLDSLLLQTAQIDPDNSEIISECCLAYAKVDQWDLMKLKVKDITRPQIKDETIRKLISIIREKNRDNWVQHALELTSQLSDPFDRSDGLLQLGLEPSVSQNLVTFGFVMQQLHPYPEKLRVFMSHILNVRPDIVRSHEKEQERIARQVTDMEIPDFLQHISSDIFIRTLLELAPELADQISPLLSKVEEHLQK